MKLIKKLLNFVIFIFLLVAGATLVSCNKIGFDDLTIIAEDLSDVSAGNHTLRYQIQNFDNYKTKENIGINVVVVDKDNTNIEVEDNRIIQIESNNNYLVTVVLWEKDSEKTKQYSYNIISERTNVTITFRSSYGNFEDITREVIYGGYLADIPEVPEYTPVPNVGCSATVTNSEWDRKNFTNITEDIVINAVYEINNTPNKYTITLDTNGGEEMDEIEQFYDTTLYPPENPTREGYVFFGWYEDLSDFSQRYEFSLVEARDFTLYARWIEKNISASESLFDFTINESNSAYTISAKEGETLSGEIVLPNVYNDKPVVCIDDYAFLQCSDITSVTIPLTIENIGVYAFSGQTLAGTEVSMNLQTVIFEATDTLVYIPEYCFASCKNLATINIPASVEKIDKKAFFNCIALDSITFEDNSKIEYIRESVFENCTSLEEVDIPSSLLSIGTKAFYNCTSLANVTLNSTVPPLWGNTVFYYQDGEEDLLIDNLAFYVPVDSISLYENSMYGDYLVQSIE